MKGARDPVYVGEHNGRKEYWFPGDRFEEIAGGAREALALKKEVDRQGLLETDRRGKGVSYVVKRLLPDGSRQFFVVIRHKPKKPSVQAPAAQKKPSVRALAAAAMVSLS